MYKSKRVVAIIPARAGSKRCPGKNTRLLRGQPLVSWSIEAALSSKVLDKIIVTSDDHEVLKISRNYADLMVIDRPKYLATDSATSFEVVEHALGELKESFNVGVLLQPTSPMRTAGDIDQAIKQCIDSNSNTCVSYVELSKPANFFYGLNAKGMQSLDHYQKIYKANGAIYVFDITYFKKIKGFANSSTLAYIMPETRSVDIDTEEEFLMAENLLGVIDDKPSNANKSGNFRDKIRVTKRS